MAQKKNDDEDHPSFHKKTLSFRQSVFAVLPNIHPMLGPLLSASIILLILLDSLMVPVSRPPEWDFVLLQICLVGFLSLPGIRIVQNTIGLWQSRFTTRPLTLRFMPATLHVSGMAGRWPRRVEHVFPLEGISLEHRVFHLKHQFDLDYRDHFPQPDHIPMRSLIFKRDGDVVSFNGLFADESELDDAIRIIEDAMRNARDMVGDGEAEVPEELRAMVRTKTEVL